MTENIDAVPIDLDNPDHIRADTMLHIADGITRTTIPHVLARMPPGEERDGAVTALAGMARGLRDNATALLRHPADGPAADVMQFTPAPPNQKGR